MTIQETFYDLYAPVDKPITIALVSDLHNISPNEVLESIAKNRPTFIAVNGDVLYAASPGRSIYHADNSSAQHFRNAKNAQSFFREATKRATVLFSTGNHELYLDDSDAEWLQNNGIIFLNNAYASFGEIVFGGLSSPYRVLANTGDASSKADHERRWKQVFDNVDVNWLEDFGKVSGYKILLSHHPEFYERFLKGNKNIDLILAGHAHGGQIRLFGRGLYAYGQGWFPKYTSGLYDGKLIVSRGLANTSTVPRINNPPEMVYVRISSQSI